MDRVITIQRVTATTVNIFGKSVQTWNDLVTLRAKKLAGVATGRCNDMVVAADGTAYVGNFGFVLGEPMQPAALARVRPHGEVDVAADGLEFPNGTVITPDGSTLISQNGVPIDFALKRAGAAIRLLCKRFPSVHNSEGPAMRRAVSKRATVNVGSATHRKLARLIRRSSGPV